MFSESQIDKSNHFYIFSFFSADGLITKLQNIVVIN